MTKLSENQWDELITEYKAGGTTMALAKKFGIGRNAVSTGLKKRNVKFHSHNFFFTKQAEERTNVHAFDEITPTSAYWLGLIFADGCVTDSNRLHLGLESTDRAHIARFKDFMGSANTVSDIESERENKTKFMSNFAIQHAHLARTLASYGIGPRKSLTAEAREDLVPNKHFWRREVDGDGSIMFYQEERRPSPTAKISLVGSEKMMHQFVEFAEPIIGKRMKVNRHDKIFQVACCGIVAYPLIKYLYEDAEVALDRKMEKAKKIIEYYEKELDAA
jgi:hypothetical protein